MGRIEYIVLQHMNHLECSHTNVQISEFKENVSAVSIRFCFELIGMTMPDHAASVGCLVGFFCLVKTTPSSVLASFYSSRFLFHFLS